MNAALSAQWRGSETGWRCGNPQTIASAQAQDGEGTSPRGGSGIDEREEMQGPG